MEIMLIIKNWKLVDNIQFFVTEGAFKDSQFAELVDFTMLPFKLSFLTTDFLTLFGVVYLVALLLEHAVTEVAILSLDQLLCIILDFEIDFLPGCYIPVLYCAYDSYCKLF